MTVLLMNFSVFFSPPLQDIILTVHLSEYEVSSYDEENCVDHDNDEYDQVEVEKLRGVEELV